MKIFLSGPMSGIEAWNFPAFNEMTAQLRAIGHEVINPAEFDWEDKNNWEQCMKMALHQLVDADAIAVLSNWHQSKGSEMEVMIAQKLGMKIFQAKTMKELEVLFTINTEFWPKRSEKA